MPEPFWKDGPRHRYTLRHAIEAGHLLKYRCVVHKRTTYYLPDDLAKRFGPDEDARIPLFPCQACGHRDCVEVWPISPQVGDWGSLPIRRPYDVHLVRWRTVKLGDEPAASRLP